MKRQIILFILMMAVTIPSLAQMVTGKVLDDLDDELIANNTSGVHSRFMWMYPRNGKNSSVLKGIIRLLV